MSFSDEDVERLIKAIGQAVFCGNALMQKVKELKRKFQEWDEYVEYLCTQVTDLADAIDKHHKRTNIARVGGAVAGITGTPVAAAGLVVAIGGAVLAPATGGLSLIPAIAGVVAAVGGGVAGAGAAVAGGAVIADAAIKEFKMNKAKELLKREEEMRRHVTDCMQELQRCSAEFEESVNLIIRMSKSRGNYSNSLKSIEETKTFLPSLKDLISNESDKMEVGELCKTLLGILSNADGIRRLLSFFSSPVKLAAAGAAVGVGILILAVPLHFANLILAAIDLHEGSKTELAAKLREHVALLQEERSEIIEAAKKYFEAFD